jgi:hypothetical protein
MTDTSHTYRRPADDDRAGGRNTIHRFADDDACTPGREDVGAPRCPYCDRVMSKREAAEQGACNDCNGGPYDPRGYGSDEMEGGY